MKSLKVFALVLAVACLTESAFCQADSVTVVYKIPNASTPPPPSGPSFIQGVVFASTSIVPNFSGTYTHSVTTGNCLIIEIATKTGEMESVLDATSGANLPGVFGSPQAVGSWYVDTYYEKVSSTEGGQKPTIEIGNIPGWGDAVMFLNEYSGLPNCSPTNKTFRGSSITNGQFASNALTTSSGSLGVGFIAFNSGTITKWSSTAPLTYLRAQIEPSWGSAGYGDAITPSGSFSFSGTLSSQSNLYGFALAVFH